MPNGPSKLMPDDHPTPAYDALRSMMHRKVKPVNSVVWYWLGGSAIAHFVGAGLWGFAQTLPQISPWTHGAQVTASPGHFAFFGAFGMLALSAVYFMVPQLKGLPRIREARGLWAYWLMALGMLATVAAFTIAGVVQTYLTRVLGLDFMMVREQYVRVWIFWSAYSASLSSCRASSSTSAPSSACARRPRADPASREALIASGERRRDRAGRSFPARRHIFVSRRDPSFRTS